MAETAAAQLTRLLHLIPTIADGEEHSLPEVARRAGIDGKMLLQDLRAISERFDDPAGFVEGVQIYLKPERVSLVSPHFLRPMRITGPELCALELGLAVLEQQRGPEEQAVIGRARSRVRALISALPAWDPESLYQGQLGNDADLAHLRSLQLARRRRRKVRIAYHKPDADRAVWRTVCPYLLAFATGRWYLVAGCAPHEKIRIFRLDRVETVETLDQGFSVPDSFSPEQYLADGKAFYAEQAETLRVRYGPAVARWIAEREGRAVDADGSVTIDHPLADAEWVVRHVLQYGPDAEVLEPASVREEMQARLAMLVDGGG
jgi:proteasome accessory factor C